MPLEPTPEEIIQKAVWVIENTVNAEKNDSPIEKMSQGTCFFLKNIGIVTAAHVLFPNKKNTTDRLEVVKYCPFCKKRTTHKETK